jgi:hypothetical protein
VEPGKHAGTAESVRVARPEAVDSFRIEAGYSYVIIALTEAQSRVRKAFLEFRTPES